MKTRTIILPVVCCIPLMNSCATDKAMEKPAWNIQPVFKVNNATADNPNALYQLGRYYQGQRRYELAIKSYRRALAADDTFAEAHNGLGVIYSIEGQYDAAITQFKIAIGQSPKSGHLYNNLGHTLYLQGAYAEAVAALEQAVTFEPANKRALNNLGLAYAKAGDQSKSRQAFAEAAQPVTQPAAQSIREEKISVLKTVNSSAVIEPGTEVKPSTEAEVAQVTPIESNVAAAPVSAIQEPTVAATNIQVKDIKTPLAQPEVQAPVVEKTQIETPVVKTPLVKTGEPEVAQLPVQTLALPKDRGVITPAPAAPIAVPNTTTPAEPVQLAVNVPEPNVPKSNAAETNAIATSKPAEFTSAPVSVAAIPAAQELPAKVSSVQPSVAVPMNTASSATIIPPILMHLEVSNGNGTTGMARKVATYLRDSGFGKARLTNRKPYTVQTTLIQYRYGHQADAKYLQASLPRYATMVQSNNLRDDINLRVVLGRDLVEHTAYFTGINQKILVTLKD